MQNTTKTCNHGALGELLGESPPAILVEAMHRRATIENDLRELLTAVEPESAREALTALYELQQEEMRLLLGLLQHRLAS